MLKKYDHLEFTLDVNKVLIPKTIFGLDTNGIEEFNNIYQYVKKNFKRCYLTDKKSIQKKDKWYFRYYIDCSWQSFEMIVICKEGCYRFIVKNTPSIENKVKGSRAVRELYKLIEKRGLLGELKAIECPNGLEVKKEIKSPHIEFLMNEKYLGKIIKHCYHIDLESAYASQFVEAYPIFTDVIKEMFDNRKKDNGFYKHVLTNSIGCFQSKYCPDINSKKFHSVKPYQFSNIAKIAVNGTREKIEDLIEKVKKSGRIPLLTNTDGLWYYSCNGPYTDEFEGLGLGKWKHDYSDVKLLVKSKGAYQVELQNGEVKTVVRGKTNLDLVTDRVNWSFGQIMNSDLSVCKYVLDDEIGIVKVWDTIGG